MDSTQIKASTSSSYSSSRSSSFSVEALISKPEPKSVDNEPVPVHHSSFSMDSILRRSSRDEDLETRSESPSTGEQRDTKETEDPSTDFPWMRSTRYDPPPSK